MPLWLLERWPWFCGCCAHPRLPLRKRPGDFWCRRCRHHVLPSSSDWCTSSWNRTYMARFGAECPFQVGRLR